MSKAICSALLALLSLGVPMGWYDCLDGAYRDPQNGKLDKALPMLSISIDNSTEQYPDYPLKLAVKLYNNREATIYSFETGIMAKNFKFELKDMAGKPVEPNKFFRQLANPFNPLSRVIPPQPINPGAFSIYIINFLKLYDLSPGNSYTIRLRKVVGLDQAYSQHPEVTSNILSFTVPK